MRSRNGDGVYESDANSLRSEGEEEEETIQHSNSQRSGKSDSSSSRNNNPIEYSDSERAELLRRLDSIKDHLLRGGAGNGNQNQPFLKPIHLHAPNPNPGPSYYHSPYPQAQAHQDPYRRPPPIPNWYPPPPPMNRYGQYVEIGSDIVEPHSFFPATPSRYNDMPPYSPVSSSQSHFPSRYNDMPSPYSPHSSFPSSMNSPGPSRGGGGGYARWPSDVDSEMGNGAFARGYVKKAVSETSARRCCHPLGGGAPFIACHSCFELLHLPKKKLLAQVEDRRTYKLQCGSCSEVILFQIIDKKLVFASSSEEEEAKPVLSPEIVDVDVNIKNTEEQEEAESVPSESRCSDDEEERSIKDVKSVRSVEDEEERLSIFSEEQGKKHVKSVRRRNRSEVSEEKPDSASLLELFEYSNVNRAALAYGMAELGYNNNKQEESIMKQESIAATETEVSSYNGYSNTEISEDSRYSNGREGEDEEEKKLLEVWVNGHLIPESLVTSAEKLAGPIQAGKYWYDYRAGFWGVMGKPCLGIIPPFIEEFSHPMPDNCAMGNTQVFVNGRELHKRDFELLVGRGLPQDKNRSYIVDISGRILDSDSGDELKSLGKLAPTIEKVKHGFGMRVPRSLVS